MKLRRLLKKVKLNFLVPFDCYIETYKTHSYLRLLIYTVRWGKKSWEIWDVNSVKMHDLDKLNKDEIYLVVKALGKLRGTATTYKEAKDIF